jgi:hypothetical protein
MRLNNKQFRNVLQTIMLTEGNFGHGFEDAKIKPISAKASVKNIVGQTLSDQSIPIKGEIVTALENIVDAVSTIQYPADSKEFAMELGKIIKSDIPAHLQGDVVGLLSRKLAGDAREFIFKGYSGR